ncbi:MAG: DNA polymerase III subunit delta [Bryobacterales bacterium]|nr:DNA polymerase III subunit delta [Bryobacterales bacterium]
MTPDQFLSALTRQGPPPVCLFLGPEAYHRDRCRGALVSASLPEEDREEGLSRHDLNESDLAALLDDARSLSLFASRRLLVAANAEGVLPHARAADQENKAAAAGLAAYLRDPVPGVTILFEATAFDFEGEDKKKLERVQKFFAGIPCVVEFRRQTPAQAAAEAARLAREAGLTISRDLLQELTESLGANVTRISVEIRKLSLYKGAEAVTTEDISTLVPDARATTVFALVNALARRDRRKSLDLLDTFVREGEYLPLALTFLSGILRLALMAKESGLRGAGQVQSHFSRHGVPMWPSKAEQVWQTASACTAKQLEAALGEIFAADRDMRGPRPDDRILMERLIWKLTAT